MSATIRLYIDEDSMDRAFVNALRARGLDLVTAFEADMIERPDREHLEYASSQERVLFSFNRGDFQQLHTEFLVQNDDHAGIVVARQQHYSIGELMRRILRLSAILSAKDMKNRLEFLNAWG